MTPAFHHIHSSVHPATHTYADELLSSKRYNHRRPNLDTAFSAKSIAIGPAAHSFGCTPLSNMVGICVKDERGCNAVMV